MVSASQGGSGECRSAPLQRTGWQTGSHRVATGVATGRKPGPAFWRGWQCGPAAPGESASVIRLPGRVSECDSAARASQPV